MAISEQDREWVRAIVKEAVLETMALSRDQLYAAIKEHGDTCALKWRGRSKAFMAGVIVASLFTGAGVVAIGRNLLLLLKG